MSNKRKEKEGTSGLTIPGKNKNTGADYKENELHLVSSTRLLNNKDPNDVVPLKGAIKQHLLVLAELAGDCYDRDALTQLNKQVNAAHYLFLSMKKQKQSSPLKPVNNSPANKNIVQQRKKKKKKYKHSSIC